MIYPHRESSTTNLGREYLEELELKAREKARKKSEYELQAIDFLLDTQTKLVINRLYKNEEGRDVYTVRLGRAYRVDSFSLFECFTNSIAATEKGEKLTAYDVLAYASMYTYRQFDTADDVYDEYVDMNPSQCQAILYEQNKVHTVLKSLYTESQLEKLDEIC